MKDMIKTTPEQSMRLINAGIDPNTADIPSIIRSWSLGALWNLCKDKSIEFNTADASAEQVIDILVERLTNSGK